MGAYSPLPWAPKDLIEQTLIRVFQPTIAEMKARDTPFIGLLYAGLALTKSGIRVIEFNARFGDPETQVLLPRLKTPLARILYLAATGNLKDAPTLEWSEDSAVTVVLASEGYPTSPLIGKPISGIPSEEGVLVFHAGTTIKDDQLISSGGRVLAVTGIGSTLAAARDKAYKVIAGISLPGSHYRRDIALAASAPSKVGEN
jgi:phosphoribosylamine--glycine ligase